MVKARTPPLDIIIVSNKIELSKRKISAYMKASKDYKDRETYTLLKTDIKPPITVTEIEKDAVEDFIEDFVGLPFV